MGCRRTGPQEELLRLVRDPTGALRTGRSAPGRGAWLCRATALDCFDLAVGRKAWAWAFRAPVSPHAVAEARHALAKGSG